MEKWNTQIDVAKVAGATLISVITSFQEQFEWWLRLLSLSLGIFYVVLKLVEHFRKTKPKD